jgi:hypothetical protein
MDKEALRRMVQPVIKVSQPFLTVKLLSVSFSAKRSWDNITFEAVIYQTVKFSTNVMTGGDQACRSAM